MITKFSGIDTETINGKCKVICNEREGIFVTKFSDITNFLFSKCNEKIVVFKLDYDILAILKYLPNSLLDELIHFGKIEYKGFKIAYIKDKEFIIRKGKKKRMLYDVFQFYNMKLDTAGEIFLKQKKIDITLDEITKYIQERNPKVIDYCIQDSKLALQLWNKLQLEFEKLKINTSRPMSLAYLSYNYFKLFFKQEKVSNVTNDFFELAYYGGRFEVLKRGYYPNACLYDINSAYPSAMNEMLSLEGSSIVENSKINKDTIYGLFYLELDFDLQEFLPLPFRQKNGKIIFPYGKFRGYYNLEDIKLLNKYKFRYTILENILINNKDKKKIIDIEHFYKLRKENKDLDYVLKILLNALYGKFAQKINKYKNKKMLSENDFDLYYQKEDNSSSTNFIFASFITSYIRAKIYDYAMLKENKVIFFSTDGLLFEDKIKIEDSIKLGSLSQKKEYQGAYIIGSGIYGLKNVKEDNIEWKRRGFFIDSKELDNLKSSKESSFILDTKKRVGLNLTSLKLKYELNKIENITKKININFDTKRLWWDSFKSGSEVFTKKILSQPIKLNLELSKLLSNQL